LIHAIIDIGSNTVRMAIYQIEYGKIELLMKKKHMLGLAAYIRDGVMQQNGIDKACETLLEFKGFLNSFKITEITAFTTAALRNIKNSKEAVQQIIDRTDIYVRVISGDEEATFDFIGATHTTNEPSGLLIDIGGASTEIIAYEDYEIREKISLHLGSLIFHTKYVEDFLPSREEIMDMEAETLRIVAEAPEFSKLSQVNICGIGGTFKGAAALYNEIFEQPKKNKDIAADKLDSIIHRFTRDAGMASADAVILMKTVPDRIQTIVPGLVIANVLAKHFGSRKITYSDSGVREGYIYDQIIREK
jgi:exopolyphosphatase / guanosine-5'-triphosphate,3'-diphosphate pyrophosphatase